MAVRDVSVVWATSEFAGAPVLRGEPGSKIELLDALLLNGFCVRAFDAVTVADGVATLTMSAGNPYVQHGVIEIRDCAQPALNRKWRVDTAGASSLTFAVDDLVPAGSHVGSGATVRYAPAGWEKPFADLGTYRAAYRSASLESTQMLLFVDDSDARYTRVRGYESMTDIDTPGVPFPTVAQNALNAYIWAKSNTAGAAQTRSWAMVADPMLMHPCIAYNSGYAGVHDVYRFGDIEAFSPADAYSCMIAAAPNTAPPYPNFGSAVMNLNSSGGPSLARAHTGAPGAVSPWQLSVSLGAGQRANAALGGRINFAPVLVSTANFAGAAVRGAVPGLLVSIEQDAAAVPYSIMMLPSPHLLVRVGNASISHGWCAFNIEGPWR